MSRAAIVRTIVDKLKLANTQQEKADVLSYYDKETLFKRILSYTYNPLIQFGMSDWQPKTPGREFGMGISKFMHIPEDIFQHKFTRDEAVFACNLAVNHMNAEEVEIFSGMLRKDLGVGLEIATINQIWPDLVPEYPLQTATEFTSAEFEKFTMPPFVAQKMSTGLRVNIIVRGNTVEFRRGNGEFIQGWDRYIEQFSKLAQNGANVFDGHAVVVDDQANIIATDNQAVLDADPKNIRFILWDVIRYDGFVQGKDQRIGYNWRFNGLEHMMILAVESNPQPCYRTPEQLVCGTISDALEYAKQTGDIVIKNLPGTWSKGPSSNELIVRKS